MIYHLNFKNIYLVFQKIDKYLGNNEYVSDDDLQDFSQKTETQIISDLNNHLKPELGIGVKTSIFLYKDQIKKFIDNEFKKYLLVIKERRVQKFELVKNLSKQYISDYETNFGQTFDSIQSDEELKRKHNTTLRVIKNKCQMSNHFEDKKLLSLQLTHIESEVLKTFNQFIDNFNEKLEVFSQAYEVMYKQSTSFYQKVCLLCECNLI